jgi:hypothetical protein
MRYKALHTRSAARARGMVDPPMVTLHVLDLTKNIANKRNNFMFPRVSLPIWAPAYGLNSSTLITLDECEL